MTEQAFTAHIKLLEANFYGHIDADDVSRLKRELVKTGKSCVLIWHGFGHIAYLWLQTVNSRIWLDVDGTVYDLDFVKIGDDMIDYYSMVAWESLIDAA